MSSSLFLSSSNFSVLASAASARSLLFEEVALGLEAVVFFLLRSFVALGLIRDGGRAVVLLLRRLGRLDVVEDLALVVLGLVVRLV